MYDFLVDLDAFFCEKYANYDKLCILPGYKMPVMQASTVRADGRTYAYTLPMDTMSLSKQADKAELLKELKTRLTDKTFSFSFQPYVFFERIKNTFSKYAFSKNLKTVLAKYNLTPMEAGEQLNVDPEIWKKIVKGVFAPTKNLLFSLALTAQLSMDDLKALFLLCGFELDYAQEKDVVITYLLEQRVYNRGMIDAALAEYRIENLFLK